MRLYTEEQVNKFIFQSAYAEYWDMVKDIIDEEGWVYTKEASHLLDTYFEANTGKPIEFQKSFGKSGDNPHWLTRGSRWRPIELSKEKLVSLTPIELPSDEEIIKNALLITLNHNQHYGFLLCAKWMKELILNQKK